MTLSPLQTRVAREIVYLTRREQMHEGDHLNESHLSSRIGISRTPVNVALRYLATKDYVVHDPNRGFFLKHNASDNSAVVSHLFENPDDPLYLKIAQDRLSKKLADEVLETELMNLYSVARSPLRSVLSRIQQEGWIERQVGQGWKFLPMIDSVEAYEESYVFRTALEPTALLSPTFYADPVELETLKKRQNLIAESGYETMSEIELFEANSEFHEVLASWSRNRFYAQAIRRMNQLRRLVEYSQARNRKPRKKHATEHLAILEAIAQHDTLGAATLLRDHLSSARREKAHIASIFDLDSELAL